MPNPIILLSRQLPPMVTEALSAFGTVEVLPATPDEELLAGAHIYLSTAVDPVSESLIASMPNLKLIANIGVGTDNIDLNAAAMAGVSVSNTPVVTEDTADLAFALLMATCRKLSVTERLLRAHDWVQAASHVGTRVHGKTLGIVGFGDIGQAVARRAKGFGMELHYYGPTRKSAAEAEVGATYHNNLPDLLDVSDIVSINCPLTEQTRHLFNTETLARMKPGAILINTARGPIVDEAALIHALKTGHLGGAGLDVFEFEPDVSRDLLELDNVTLLPHIGSASIECRTDMVMRVLGNVRNFLENGAPLDRVV